MKNNVLRKFIFVLAVSYVGPAFGHCNEVPDLYGELEIAECSYYKEGDTGAILRKMGNPRPKSYTRVEKLPEKFWGAVLVGSFKKRSIIFERPATFPKKIVSSKRDDDGKTSREYQVDKEISTVYVTKDTEFCKTHGSGKKVFLSVFFMCCDTSSVAPPCGFGAWNISDVVSFKQIKKYEKAK
jgi:hypothetical protein